MNERTRRGLTMHEHLDSTGIIHMNGRAYDPLIGRFLSADPVVSAPFNGQSLNRYSYVLNNPLSLTDPSGFVPGAPDDFDRWDWEHWMEHNAREYEFPFRGRFSGFEENITRAWIGGRWVDLNSDTPAPVGGPTESNPAPETSRPGPQPQQPTQSSTLDSIGGVLFPNITALGQQGVQGTFANDVVGGLKAAYNAAQAIAALNSPSLLISGPHQLEIADTELVGASVVEAGTAIFGLASVGGNVAAKGVSAYSVAFETTIQKAGAGTRPAHFAAANRILQETMAADSSFAAVMQGLGIRIPSRLGESPAGWSWHHVPDRPGVMQLVPRGQHQGGFWQRTTTPRPCGRIQALGK